MTRKQRAFTMEAVGIIGSFLLLALAVPGMVNSRDTLALFAALLLIFGAVGWLAYFAYRINREIVK